MSKEGWVRHIVISDEGVFDNGKLATPENAALFRQKLVEENEIWNGKWNGWKPEPVNPYDVKPKVIWQINTAKDQVLSGSTESQPLQDVT